MPSPEAILIIPAAGSGTRLQSSVPKVLTPVNGKPMIDHLFDRYRNVVRRFIVVVHPLFESMVQDHCSQVAPDVQVDYATQAHATGMLDAILLAADAARDRNPDRVWITWCDQIAVHPHTVATLQRMSAQHSDADAIFPTTRQTPPYIHLERDADGRIAAVRQRREGDPMPEVGESDMGLFSLSPAAFFNALPVFGREATSAAATHERNFLPFMPWLAARGGHVLTFPSTSEVEAIGVNTPDDLNRVEQYLREIDRS